jgi:hypothetical protein
LPEVLKHFGLLADIDPLAVDLMRKLICPAARRLSLGEVLRHPWLAAVPAASVSPAAGDEAKGDE